MTSSLSPSALRLPFLLANFIAGRISTSPPNSSPAPEEIRRYKNDDESLEFLTVTQWWFLPTLWVVSYAFHLSDLYITLAAAYPLLRSSMLLGMILPSRTLVSSLANSIYVSPTLILGSLLCFSGAVIRFICYRTLGRHFTFELSLRKGHKLVTEGPYSIVRHPSYLGSVLYFSGMYLSDFGQGSWWREAGMWSTTFGKVLGTVRLSSVAFVLYSLLSRISKEDRVMREEFGQQWVEWSKRTPYKLIPGVY